MLAHCVVRLVDLSRRFAWMVALLALAASLLMGAYVARTIKVNTDIDQLMADDLPWRQKEKEMSAAFPHKADRLVIVIDGANADLAENAAAKLTAEIQKDAAHFKSVTRPDSIPYFQKYGLLFLSEKELGGILDVLIKAQPMLGSLANDPSLRGLFGTMALAVEGVTRGEADYKQLEPSFTLMAQTMEAVSAGQAAKLPWQSMMSDRAPTLRDVRKFIITQPVLDFTDLSPGKQASRAVRHMAEEMKLTPENGVTVRLTGPVALNDEEFASVAEGTQTATVLSVVLVIVILFLALRSFRLIVPILLTLAAGLAATTAFAMATIGSLNLISVAFAVMFVGIAVDFGIQFGVRYRDVHHGEPDHAQAMRETARRIATPLFLAAIMTALGFAAFIPTDYRGVAELGIIAGAGMLIAFALNITLLPALLTIFKPPAEPESIGYAWAAPIDLWVETNRKKLLYVIGGIAIVATLLASQMRFDFDPLNLKNPDTESVSTLFDIMKDPDATIYTVDILAPDLETARAWAGKIDALPQVDHTITLASFVPKEQDAKLALINDAKFLLDASLNPPSPLPAPTDKETIDALRKTAAKLRTLGEDKTAAQKLATQLEKVADRNDPKLLSALHESMIAGMQAHLDRVKNMLTGEAATIESITDDLKRDWIAADGRAKIEVYPKGDARDHRVLSAFTDAVRSIVPEATGTSISIQESGKTIVNAFIKAGLLGLAAIALAAWIFLKRATDVLWLILPLILAGILTLATMVTISLPLNFANIIALPLLLSLGVSYAIYFVTYWQNGHDKPLQSSMSRAVLFSASTTLVAFGALSLSSHPGTQGMGQLLTIALIYCLLCTFIALPVLLGRPRLK